MPTRIKLRTPNFMQGLMLSPPERYRRSKSHVEVAKILKTIHQPFGVEQWAVPFQRFNQDVTRLGSLQETRSPAVPRESIWRARICNRGLTRSGRRPLAPPGSQ